MLSYVLYWQEKAVKEVIPYSVIIQHEREFGFAYVFIDEPTLALRRRVE
jgi:hypothetical protein